MARHELPRPDACSDDPDTFATFDVLIRHSLHRAFPLPAGGHADDARFRRLLDALARRHTVDTS